MKHHYRLALFFLIFIFTSWYAATGPGNIKENKQLSLDDFIKLSCESNPEFRKIIIDRLYLEYSDDLNLDMGELIAGFETGYLYSLDTDKDGFTGGVTVSRLFAETATEVSSEYNTAPGNAERSSSLNFKISQEIAENSFGRKWRLEKESNDFKKELILYKTAEAYEDYFYYLVTLYYNWMSSWRELESAEKSYRESQKLFDNIVLRLKSRIADQEDVNRSELQLLSKMEDVSTAENKYEKNTITVYDAAGISTGSGFIPSAGDAGFDYSGEEIFKNSSMKKGSRTYRILDISEKIGIKNVEIGKNSLLPGISMFTSFSLSGAEYSFSGDRERVLSLGLELKDIGKDRKEKAALETAGIDLEKIRLENRITRKDLDIKLLAYSKDIENSIRLAEIYEKKKVLAEKILEQERKLYSIGKTDLSSLIDAINTLDQNRKKKLDYESELNILIAGWLNLTDSLVSEKEAGSSGFRSAF